MSDDDSLLRAQLRLIQQIRNEVAGLDRGRAWYSQMANPPWDCTWVQNTIVDGYIWPSDVNAALDRIQAEILNND